MTPNQDPRSVRQSQYRPEEASKLESEPLGSQPVRSIAAGALPAAPDEVRSPKYGRMAGAYALETRLISLGANERAQLRFLDRIRVGDSVLTIGCGSIGFNRALAEHVQNLDGASVTFLDIEPKMIGLVRKNVASLELPPDKARFEVNDIMKFQARPYDVVMASFFLNVFTWEDCRKVLAKIAPLVKEGGALCIADAVRAEKAVPRFLQLTVGKFIDFYHWAIAGRPMHPPYDYSPELAKLGLIQDTFHRDESDFIASATYRKG